MTDLQLVAPTGKCIVVKDPMLDRVGLIYLPDNEKKEACQGLCLLHSPSSSFGEGDLSGKRVAFVKYSDKTFTLQGTKLCVIDERDILAVLLEEEGQ